MCSDHLFLCSYHGFMKGECDEINDEHEGSDVIFGLTIFLTSRPNLSRYPSFFGSTHPEVKNTTHYAINRGFPLSVVTIAQCKTACVKMGKF